MARFRLDKETYVPLGALALVFVIAIGIYVLWFGYHLRIPAAATPDVWGQFGDYLGGVLNPLIGASTLIWLIRSVQLQKTELMETKVALIETQKAQQEQARLALLSAQRETLNLKLASVVSDLGHYRSTMNVWLANVNSNDRMSVVFTEHGHEVPILSAMAGTRGRLKKLEQERVELLREIDSLAALTSTSPSV